MCVLLAALALLVPRLLIVGAAIYRAPACGKSAPASPSPCKPAKRSLLLASQLHLAAWQQ
jgi:hypothetical protein